MLLSLLRSFPPLSLFSVPAPEGGRPWSRFVLTAFCPLAFLLIAFPGDGHAQQTPWQALGPEGGEVTAFAAHPQRRGRLVAGTAGGGIFLSTDLGQTWRAAEDAPTVGRIESLLIPRHEPDVVYAGTDRGLFKSSDGGSDWTPSGNGIPREGTIYDLLWVRGQQPPITAPPGPPALFAATQSGVYRSYDGESWEHVDEGLFSLAGALAFDEDREVLYSGTQSGVYRSFDYGERWEPISNGLPLAPEASDLVVDPFGSGTVYVALRRYINPYDRVVYRLPEGQPPWEWAGRGLPATDFAGWHLAADPQQPGVLYAGGEEGLYASTDGGTSWSARGGERVRRPIEALLVDPFARDRLYAGVARFDRDGSPAGEASGILVSTNAGRTWNPRTEGVTGGWILSLTRTVDGAGGEILVAGTENLGPVARPLDEPQADWQPLLTGAEGEPGPWTGAVEAAPGDRRVLYLLAGDFPEAYTRLHRSEDGGSSWTALASPPQTPFDVGYSEILLSSADPDAVYVSGGWGAAASRDGGATWRLLWTAETSSRITGFAVDPADPDTLFLGTVVDSGIPVSPPIVIPLLFRSTDGGETWEKRYEGEWVSVGASWQFAFDPHRPGHIATSATSYRSDEVIESGDGGLTWRELSRPAIEIQTLAYDPAVSGLVYAGTYGNGVHLSTDGGMSWTPFNRGLGGGSVRVFSFDPLPGGAMYIGTGGAGVFRLPARPVEPPCRPGPRSACLQPSAQE